MDTTTPQGVPSAEPNEALQQGVDPADQFQSLFDAGAFEPTDEHGNDIPGQAPDPDRRPNGKQPPKPKAQGEESPEAQESDRQADGEQAQAKDEKAGEGTEQSKEYESLDAYLKEQNLDPESFMQLPVTVKVDGQERSVPLAELQKSYQLSSAAYDRMRELAAERQSFATETAQVRQALGLQIQRAETLLAHAQQMLLGEFQGINWQQLNQENPVEYARQWNAFQMRQAQIAQAQQQIEQTRQQQAQQAEEARLQALPRERERLLQAHPEWADPAKAQEAQRQMVQLGRKLGFSDAELGSIFDHRMLLVLDMAARYAQLQASAPQQLKRVRAAPQMGKSGVRQPRDPQRVRVTQARDAWARSGYRNDDAAAALLQELG